MPFTSDEIANINNAVLETFIDRGTVFRQNVANKPMLEAFNAAAGASETYLLNARATRSRRGGASRPWSRP